MKVVVIFLGFVYSSPGKHRKSLKNKDLKSSSGKQAFLWPAIINLFRFLSYKLNKTKDCKLNKVYFKCCSIFVVLQITKKCCPGCFFPFIFKYSKLKVLESPGSFADQMCETCAVFQTWNASLTYGGEPL